MSNRAQFLTSNRAQFLTGKKLTRGKYWGKPAKAK